MDFEEIILTDVLSQETDIKPETLTEKIVNEFIPTPEPIQSVTAEEIPQPEEEPKKNPEDSADAIIDMLNILNTGVFSIIRTKKLKGKYPEKVFDAMQNAVIKEMTGETLTDTDKIQLKKFKEFEMKMNLIKKDTPFSKEENESLKPATLAFVKQMGFEVGAGVWFGVKVTEMFSKRIIDIIMD